MRNKLLKRNNREAYSKEQAIVEEERAKDRIMLGFIKGAKHLVDHNIFNKAIQRDEEAITESLN